MVTLVWSSEAVFRSFQRRSGQGQAKKGQIFKFLNVDKKGIYLDQFWLRNLMVSFVFPYDPQKNRDSHLVELLILRLLVFSICVFIKNCVFHRPAKFDQFSTKNGV